MAKGNWTCSGTFKLSDHYELNRICYVLEHDVAPTVDGTTIDPELIPEGAGAAAFGKFASVAGASIKEEGITAKVVTTFEGSGNNY